MEPPAAPHDDGLAAITRQNLRALLVTRSQLQALAPLIAALAGHVGHELAEALLEGCFVRLRSPEGYILRRILSAQLPPLGPEAGTADVADDPSAGAWPLTVEVEVLQPGKPSVRVLAMRVSDADPFHDPAAYDAGGREELRRHRAERAAAGCPPGLPLGPTAAAAWRRHVALIWANGSLLGTLGVSQLVAGLQDDAKLEEQLQFIQKLEPQAPAPGPLYAPPAATPAADAQPEASEDAAAAVATPAYVLPAAAAGERLPVDAAGPAAAPQQAAALPGPAFESGLHLPAVGSGLPLQEQQQPQASMQQPVQPVQPAYADPARQPQQWQGPGQQAMHPWHHPPAGMQPQSVRVQPGQVLGPSPFETAAAAAPRVGLAWPASGPPPPQQQQQAWQGQLPPRCSLPAGPSLGGSALGGAASGTAPPWAGGVLDPRGSAAGGPGVQPGSPRFFGLTVTALPAGTTDGQLAAFIRPKYPHSFASARVTEARRGVIKFTSLEERDAAYSEVNGMLFAGNVLGTEMPAGEPPPPVACLWVSSLPSDCRNAAVLNLFRQRFPSVMSVRHLGAPRQSAGSRDASCFVRFPSEEERDAALVEMHGALFEGYPIRTDMPKGDKLRWSHRPLASLLPQRGAAEGPPAGAPAAPLQLRRSQQAEAAPKPARHKKQAEAEGLFPLLVLNVGDAMSQEELLEYFRERYPSAASVVMQHGFGTVRFSSDQERQRAHVEMEGHVLPGGRKIGTGLPAGTVQQQPSTAPAPPAAADGSGGKPAPVQQQTQQVAPPLAQQPPEQHLPAQQLPQSVLPPAKAQQPDAQVQAVPAGQAGAPCAATPAAAPAVVLPAPAVLGWPAAAVAAPGPAAAAAAAAVAAGALLAGRQPQLAAVNPSLLSSAGWFVPTEGPPLAGLPAMVPATTGGLTPTIGSTEPLSAGRPLLSGGSATKAGGSAVAGGGGGGKAEVQRGSSGVQRQQKGEVQRAGSQRDTGQNKRGASPLARQQPSKRTRSSSRSPARRRQGGRRSRSPVWRQNSPGRRASSRRSRSPPRHEKANRPSPSPQRLRSGRRSRSRSLLRRAQGSRRSRSPPGLRHSSRPMPASPAGRKPPSSRRRSPSPPTQRGWDARRRSPIHERRRSPARQRSSSSGWQPGGVQAKRSPLKPAAEHRRSAQQQQAQRAQHTQPPAPCAWPVAPAPPPRSGTPDLELENELGNERSGTPDAAELGVFCNEAELPAAAPRAAAAQAAAVAAAALACGSCRGRSATPDAAAAASAGFSHRGRSATPDAAAIGFPLGRSATPDAAEVLGMRQAQLQAARGAAGEQPQQAGQQLGGQQTGRLQNEPQSSGNSSMQISQEGASAEHHAGGSGDECLVAAGRGRPGAPAGQQSSSSASPPLPPPLPPQCRAPSPAPPLPDQPRGSNADSPPPPLPPPSPSQPRPASPAPPPPPPPDPGSAADGPSLPPGFGPSTSSAGAAPPAPAQWVPPGLAWQHQPPDEAWARSPMDARWMCPPPGAPDLPPWLPRLFMDACHRLDWRRGLPLADREVLQEMDELAGEPVCLRSLGISMYRLCLLMEERGLVRLRPTPGAAIVTELCM